MATITPLDITPPKEPRQHLAIGPGRIAKILGMSTTSVWKLFHYIDPLTMKKSPIAELMWIEPYLGEGRLTLDVDGLRQHVEKQRSRN